MDRHDVAEVVETVLLAPVHKPADGAVVGLAGVGVSDGDCEEVDEAPGGTVICAGDHGRQPVGERRRGAPPEGAERDLESWIWLLSEISINPFITAFMEGFISGDLDERDFKQGDNSGGWSSGAKPHLTLGAIRSVNYRNFFLSYLRLELTGYWMFVLDARGHQGQTGRGADR